MKTLYTVSATSTGGRNGKVKSENGVLDLEVKSPKALGGENDDYANPEMLFAAGYAACFDSALSLVINMAKKETGETSVEAKVSLHKTEDGGYMLSVELDVNIPGVTSEEAHDLVEKANKVCPYSIATSNNIEVKLSATNN